MAKRPIVLIHGYSDRGESFGRWAQVFRENGYAPEDIRTVTYVSLVNDISIKDIAEGFEKILREQAGLNDTQPFDAVVHSTGMLVLRSWLVRYADRNLGRVKHLIGLAPATFGSPLAHKGRSWLGAVFKGNKELSPDFLNTGDQVLSALELGSSFTWELAEKDLVGKTEFYGPDNATPWVFTFCGVKAYGGLRRFVNAPGTDGTVRLAGCPLNAQKVHVDLSGERPLLWSGFRHIDCPLWPVPDLNHGSILSEPSPLLIQLVLDALEVESKPAYETIWFPAAKQATDPTREKLPQWQQFVIHALDERGDPIRDYHLELSFRPPGGGPFIVQDEKDLNFDVHAYTDDPSFRCFQLDVAQLRAQFQGEPLHVQFIADTGSRYVVYRGVNAETRDPAAPGTDALWQARVEIPTSSQEDRPEEERDPSFFYPFTTTLVELTLNREVNLPDLEKVVSCG